VCGIVGLFGDVSGDALERVRRMADSIAHRGPDDSGVEAVDPRVVLGHRRLSILDLSPAGHQPMVSASGQSWIVYNGEIYNFREVRDELLALGHRFRSESDTEMILEAHARWGIDAVRKFRGMFAFALWDARTRELHLCRDRFGVKPLYFTRAGGTLAFASEMRAIYASRLVSHEVDPQSLAEFVQFGYFASDASILKAVRAVAPGTVLTFNERLESRVTTWWSTSEVFDSDATRSLRAELGRLDEGAVLDRLEQELTTAFRYRMVADVPVGLFLSGGIDSSTVATVLARKAGVKLRTFTIGYGAESEFDETVHARDVANRLGSEHTEHIVSEQDALDVALRLPEIADEPIGDSSLIPTFLVSQMARRHVTVALSADGADEIFGGYPRYQVCGRFVRRQGTPLRWLYALSADLLGALPQGFIASMYAATRGKGGGFAGINDKIRKFRRMAGSRVPFEAYEAAISEWAPEDAQALTASRAASDRAARSFARGSKLDAEDSFMHFDSIRYLPGDLLTKVDRASMAVSLEAREPFLDHELARFGVALPLGWKLRDGRNKYALRRILARHLPNEIFERPKKGFSAPVGQWLRGPLKALVQDELSPARVRQAGLLDASAVQRALDEFLAGGGRSSPAGIWFLLQVQQWAHRWMRN
jgi:asparagine synthase (glutamine-hydrolysing)